MLSKKQKLQKLNILSYNCTRMVLKIIAMCFDVNLNDPFCDQKKKTSSKIMSN